MTISWFFSNSYTFNNPTPYCELFDPEPEDWMAKQVMPSFKRRYYYFLAYNQSYEVKVGVEETSGAELKVRAFIIKGEKEEEIHTISLLHLTPDLLKEYVQSGIGRVDLQVDKKFKNYTVTCTAYPEERDEELKKIGELWQKFSLKQP